MLYRYCEALVVVLILTSCVATKKVPVIQSNHEYHLERNIDLNGQDWILPDGAKIVCSKNGLVKNGRIIGRYASLINVRVESVSFSGSFRVLDIELMTDVDSLCYDISCLENFILKGNNHIVSSTSLGVLKNTNICIEDVMFDCTRCDGPFLYAIGNGLNTFVVENSKFINVPEIELLIARNVKAPLIRGCQFIGIANKFPRTIRTLVLNRFYECKGNVVFDRNLVRDCFGIAVGGIGFSKEDSVSVMITNNTICNVTNGGIVFNGGTVSNVLVTHNVISNVFCCGTQFDSEKGNAENAAINFHGFNNLTINNNTITNCIYSSAMDIDGSAKDGSQNNGVALACTDNKMENVLNTSLLGVKNAEIARNIISIAVRDSVCSTVSAININACDSLSLNSNRILITKPQNRSAYPIILCQNSNLSSGTIIIDNNTIMSDSDVYLMIYEGFTGSVSASNNNAISTTEFVPLKWVNNSQAKGININDKNIYK